MWNKNGDKEWRNNRALPLSYGPPLGWNRLGSNPRTTRLPVYGSFGIRRKTWNHFPRRGKAPPIRGSHALPSPFAQMDYSKRCANLAHPAMT